MVGRTFWADQSINASTGPTSNPLIQVITISGKRNLSIIESCLHEDQWISKAWTISPFTKLELPITCSLAAENLNCSAMPIRSSVTQKNILPNLRMKILEQQWSKEETPLTDNQPKFLLCTGGIILLIWSLAKIGIKLTKEGIKLASCRASGNIRINIPTAPLAPEPFTPVIQHHGHSAGITHDIIRQNNEIQLPLEKNKAQNEALLLHYCARAGCKLIKRKRKISAPKMTIKELTRVCTRTQPALRVKTLPHWKYV